jgi:hypothetical protein
MTIPGASIDARGTRGATFIGCNNAIELFAGMLAAKRGLEAGAVYADLKVSILPQVELIPGMVIAAVQEHG